ncbi:MAG: hypothetical protein OM95_01950 [Bdellovibrio sp. ArHS]|uniref:hypothetical protein n=1 Tax=Bdellovibrio sp. ArHS TaxID=1569284 RepID=UPI000583DC08|nr:hypothetical protein [Bdellovibrio sp. ArHS]KHD89846.1 MAG: hypothetical protein OM95_01950 [Bdellovibrio sp. ArHS]
MKLIAAFSLVLILGACATKSPTETRLQKLNDVGVVALFDDTLPVKYVGTGKKGSREVSANITGWSLNQSVSAEIQNNLKSKNKNVFLLNVDPEVIKVGKQTGAQLKDIYLGNRYQLLQDYLGKEAVRQNAKYLFVLHPTTHEGFADYRAGFGFYCQTNATNSGDLQGYTLLRAQLWNVTTKEMEATVNITPEDLTFKTGKTCAEALKLSPDKVATLYKEQMMELAKKSADLVLIRTGLQN